MMTVKDFLEKTTGVDEYEIEARDVWTCCRANEKERVIKNYGERKIVSVRFYVDSYEDKCAEIEIE